MARLSTESKHMYLIELKPGKEAVYGTLEAFTDAVRRGEIGWQARIYHQAKSTWLPVTVHPHFKKLVERPAGQAAAAAPARSHWTFLPPERGHEASSPAAEQGSAAAAPSHTDSDVGSATKVNTKGWRSVLGGLIGARRG